MQSYQVAQTILNTAYGEFECYCFSWGRHTEDTILCLCRFTSEGIPLVRIQSSCFTSEIFRSMDCDCYEQLEMSLRRICQEGGMLIYMISEGRGAGLFAKIQGLELGRTQGLDTMEAYQAMGIEQDVRTYDRVAEILDYFGIPSIRLLTNNPLKIDALIKYHINVIREPLEIDATDHSRAYLATKAHKMGHLFGQFDAAKED